jgi:polyhydroxyalkanoate synthesis regulator phasin
MTHSEDVKRVSTPETIDFLNARVEALERRVRLLEAKLEVEQQRNLYNNL